MALCDNCMLYNKQEDEFRQQYDDVVEIDGDKRQKHYCSMYDDNIPNKIFYENGDCPFHIPKDGD